MVDHILKMSQEQHKTITIIYQSGDQITQRNIQVSDIQDGNVKAFCYLRNQSRVFKIENILSAGFVRNTHLKVAR